MNLDKPTDKMTKTQKPSSLKEETKNIITKKTEFFLGISKLEKLKLQKTIETFIDHVTIAMMITKKRKEKQEIIHRELKERGLKYSNECYNTMLRISSVHELCEEILTEARSGHYLDFDVQEAFLKTIKNPDNYATDTEILEDTVPLVNRMWIAEDEKELTEFLKTLEIKLAVETFFENMIRNDNALKGNKIPYSEIEIDPNADEAHLMIHGGNITLEALFLEILPIFKKYNHI